ncbi:hypothetical protein B0J12DRAFT_693635 [Macrophomina phaseolina]|uniref:Uncharacterized protein n=1 Tax=Macrophomina phaseolina TaxID=35725 RepID=A0ABQ8GW14_9PEZI|nr:hypothetical protein B0J12DRAFT_693635 [Macrophomina phaseolina]
MSWLKTALLNFRTAFSAAPQPGGARNIEAAIQTSARKTLAQEPSKLANSPKRLLTSPSKSARPLARWSRATYFQRAGETDHHDHTAGSTTAPKTPEELAWQEFLEEPSPHQRLAPYA